MEPVFFSASKDALDNITSVFDFVHPLNVSLRYTRKIIEDAIVNDSQVSDLDLRKLIDPTHLVHGVAYRKAFVDTTWSIQEENLAWLLLNNLFAIHEGWAQRLFEEVFDQYYTKDFIKKLELSGLSDQLSNCFIDDILNPKGISKKLPQPLKASLVLALKSSALEGAFFHVYKTASSLDFTRLENYMLGYRCFKEARNCFMHHNFVASNQLIDAYNKYSQIATTADLDVKEVPIISQPNLGLPVQLSLRAVIGFSQIIRRIIIISDINLLCTKAAEKEFLTRMPQNWTRRTLNSDISRAKGQITRYSTKVGFLKPQWTQEYQDFLVNNGIFSH